MTGELVLITGATGHVGFRTLVTALEAGYHVRSAIRRQEQAETIKATKSVQPFKNNLSFTIVPDITKRSAFEEALHGVVYVLHIASPLAIPSEDPETDIIQPAIHGTTSILESAANTPTVKRVVITSSTAVIGDASGIGDKDKAYSATDILPAPKGPYANSFAAYSASKLLAYHAAIDFMAKIHPEFELTAIHPSFIIGKNELITRSKDITKGTNAFVIGPILGNRNPTPLPGSTVFVNDIAKLHVQALSPDISSNKSYLGTSEGVKGIEFNSVLEIAQKNFPREVEKGTLPLGGSQPTVPTHYDSSNSENVFGWKFQSFEEQTKSVVHHYLELLEPVSST
ncbi:MAG: hypothetical protein M1827_001756 [Pycnora praestabilis]|nr:MAG: hypothetical protein M1827_001756 [Pycnora praestabilis]